MRRLVPGTRIHLPDGRRMTVLRIETVDGIRVAWWCEETPERLAEELAHRLAAFRVAKQGAQALRELYQPADPPWYANTGDAPDQQRLA